ncbi:growth-regulating factor 8 isoform X2 [Sesamum indicum]|uniref:Growth-regulating factor n=1 Tax=Sesamum indicum TaxID=4182 RepID=A0A6I9SKH4_SESIN|nr:growth-regulating factor 8 isoform X2 [Sesamum indicum]
MRNGSERKSSSPSMLDCDVGLGLKMQLPPSESYSCDGGGSGGPTFGNAGNQVACFGDLYGAADTLSLPRISHSTALGASGGSMAVSGKALFTASQWQELERQKVIHKYIMASIPVPPQLLLPTSSTSSPLPSLSQSNTSGLDLRFSSNGSDPEPWRCKRTDGKKWRCSRDVAPDQKYCERHAHKSRPRSRKHVEVSAHNPSSQQQPLILPATSTTTPPLTQPLQTSTPQFPTMASTASFDKTRCVEWFMRGGSSSSSRDTVPVSTCNQQQQQQWQQLIQTSSSSSSSSRLELNRDNTDHAKNVSLYQYEGNKQGFMSLNHYIPDTISLQRLEHHQHQQHQLSSSFLDSKMGSLQESCLSLNTDQGAQTTTRHFIDALSKKFSPSALSLSMSGGNGADGDNENSDLGNVGMMMNSDRDSDGVLKSQWLSSASWMNSPPGGPLGEALCLGNASGTRAGGSNLPSPHGYSNSNTNSSCSKSSCEDGSHALNFIG